MTDLLISDCGALLPTSDGTLEITEHCDISVSGTKIVGIGPHGSLTVDPATEVLSANGQIAMPGLINCHSHSPMVLFRGLAEDVSIDRWFNDFIWPLESNLSAEDVYWGMMAALGEMIESGVTTVADHYFHMDQVGRAVEEAGTRAALGSVVFGDDGLDVLAQSAEFAEAWGGAADGRITTWMAPHAPYTCDDDFLRAAGDHARRLGVGVHIHASEEMGQTEASLASRGQTPIEVLAETGLLESPTIIAHGCGIVPADLEILAGATSVGVAHAPKTYMKLGMGLTPLVGLAETGVPVGLATDGPASCNTLDIFENLRLMAMTQKLDSGDPERMPIGQALTIAGRGSAQVVGLDDRIGRLETGLEADIILVDTGGLHHQPVHSIKASLVYNARASDVTTTIVAGRVLMRDRELLTIDKAEVVAKVGQTMDRLSRRVPGDRIQTYSP